ncbi:glycosyltransferase family 2 protein [Candidatus Woesearchaeota archaeon]|nr:glycosyltransferase family 2 protein [Candidatus Woesearchaeota archaeon]
MAEILKIILWIAYFISLYFAVFWFMVLLEDKPKRKAKKLQKLPFVSIVIPAFNEEKKIRPTVKSVLELEYPRDKYEIIVVNDGSTDKTQEITKSIINEYKSHDIKLISQTNKGKGAALNKGLRKAKGEYFICLDADSYVSRDALSKTLPHFTNEKIAAVLPLLKVSNPKTLLQKMQWLEYIVNMFYKELMGKLDCVHVAPGPFSIYRKSILGKIGGFDEKNLTEDLEITLRLQKHNYRIVQLLNTDVYTIAPSSFRELYRQRNRWYKGSVMNVITYRRMMFNKNYGDFGIIQMPTIIISGLIAIIIFISLAYYALKPQLQYLYNLSFVNFDLITLIKNFTLNLHYLDLNYMTFLLVAVMLGVSLYMIKKSHAKTNEHKITKYGIFSFLCYLILYFFILGLVWIGVVFDLITGKRQKW